MARKTPKKAAAGFDGVDIGFLGSREEPADQRTVESRKKLRDSLSEQIEAFLDSGGEIEEVPSNITADPPQKPSDGEYKNRPL